MSGKTTIRAKLATRKAPILSAAKDNPNAATRTTGIRKKGRNERVNHQVVPEKGAPCVKPPITPILPKERKPTTTGQNRLSRKKSEKSPTTRKTIARKGSSSTRSAATYPRYVAVFSVIVMLWRRLDSANCSTPSATPAGLPAFSSRK